MTTVGVSVASTEFDAAQALLDLQGNVRDIKNEQSDAKCLSDCAEDMEKSAKFILSCFIASQVDPISTKKTVEKDPRYEIETSESQYSSVQKVTKRTTQNSDYVYNSPYKIQCREEHTNKNRVVFKRNPVKHSNQLLQTSVGKNTLVNSQTQAVEKSKEIKRDIGTQTEDKYQLPIIQNMELTIQKLCEKIKCLEEQIKTNSELLQSIEQGVSDDDRADVDGVSHRSITYEDMTLNESHIQRYSDVDDELSNSDNQVKENDPEYNVTQKYKSNKVLSYNSSINMNTNDMVPIGEGNATIPSRIYRHINWNSYTSATRKLLTAVFSRKVLATHSLTGKPSPAFPNKPAKKKLDSSLINDIVLTVVERCNVPENVVRTSITTKCADESKMFRTRQKNKKKRKYKLNRENIPPGSDSEDV